MWPPTHARTGLLVRDFDVAAAQRGGHLLGGQRPALVGVELVKDVAQRVGVGAAGDALPRQQLWGWGAACRAWSGVGRQLGGGGRGWLLLLLGVSCIMWLGLLGRCIPHAKDRHQPSVEWPHGRAAGTCPLQYPPLRLTAPANSCMPLMRGPWWDWP